MMSVYFYSPASTRRSILTAFKALVLLFAVSGCTHRTDANALAGLHKLLKEKDYFRLEASARQHEGSISEEDNLYFKSFIDNAFNRNADCVSDVDRLFNSYRAKLSDTAKAELFKLQGDSYFKLYQYAKSAACCDSILKHYPRVLKPDELADIKNDSTMRGALRNVPQQQTIIKDSTTIRWHRDNLGLIEIPAKTGKSAFDAIFDTRANISSITQTYARKLGLRMLDVSYNEGSGITGIQFKTGLGIADSLYIGDILVKNVVFQVMSDSILYIAQVKFQLNVIIGFPAIEQLKEIHLFKDGRMTIPASPQNSDLHNFALDGLDPVIALNKGNDTLLFHFDSGASSSTFYKAYFDKYKSEIEKTGIKKVVGFGGAGGMQKKEVYIIPHLQLGLGKQAARIDSASVLTQKIIPNEYFSGNIGQDFIGNFNELIYNFKYMYIAGR